MRKTLAILATVATVGATAVTAPAPAEARGIGPGLAFGLAAGALAAGAAASAYGPYGYYGPGYGYYGYGPGYYRPAYYGYEPFIGTTTGAITGNEKARNIVSGLFLLRVAGHLPRIRQTRWRAMSVEGASAPKKLALGPE